MKWGENIYDVAKQTPEELRWLIEFNYLPGAKRGEQKQLDMLKAVYDENFNPGDKTDLNCPGCRSTMIEVCERLINYWNNGG